MKTFWLSVSLLCTLIACKENKQSPESISESPFNWATLPADWVQLTKTDSGLIIFNSCDAGNLLITLSKEKGKPGLLMHGMQEDYDFEVLKTIYTYNDTLLINTKWRGTTELQNFKLVWENQSKGIAKWITSFKDGNTMQYICVTADHQKEFKTVNQPCKECWGDECDEMEKANAADSSKKKDTLTP